eukprot:1609552-Rhodomonas_salina.1
MTLDNVSDTELAEYLIGYAIELTLPMDFYPEDNGQWTISCSDTHVATTKDAGQGFKKGATLMSCITISAPQCDKIGHSIRIP